MARKKTPGTPSDDTKATGTTEETGAAADGAAAAGTTAPKDGKVVSVTDTTTDAGAAERSGASDPETVDAEIVSEPAAQDVLDGDAARTDAVETRAAGADEAVAEADATGPVAGESPPAKKGGFPWGVIAALVLIGVVGWVVYSLMGDSDPERIAEEDAPGVVVSEAERFPGNELDADNENPIRGAAAPGTREAARAADEAAETDGDDAAVRTARRAAAPIDGLADEDDDEADAAQTDDAEASEPARLAARDAAAASETDDAAARVSALRERAAARRQGQRPAAQDADDAADSAGDSPFYVSDAQADDGDDADEADRASSATDAADGGAATDMAARVAAARAAQARMREEDRAQRAAGQTSRPAPAQGEDEDEAGRDTDDPNALPEFTQEEPEGASDADFFGQRAADADTDDAEAEGGDAVASSGEDTQRGEDEAQTARADRTRVRPTTRPTGRVTPLGGTAPAEDDSDEGDPAEVADSGAADALRARIGRSADRRDEDDADERLIDPRGAEVDLAAPRVATLPDEAATEEELNEALTEVRADLREDVLAETEARIRTAIEETEREVESLRAELDEREARSDQRIAQLTDRLEVLQRRDASASQQGVLILALSNLAGTVERGEPFARQLDDVERLAPNARSLNAARPYAREGLPTDRVLSERFQDAARRALAAEGRADAEGYFARMMANLRGLFTVRRIGEVEGDTPSAIISRAEAALERDDLAAAVRELGELDGAAAEAFEPWMEDARAKASVTERIDRLERAVLAQDR